jgi:hypothetical protein
VVVPLSQLLTRWRAAAAVERAARAWRTLPYACARAGTELTGPVALRLLAPHGEEWSFGETTATAFVRGDAVEFCLLAARRVALGDTGLRAQHQLIPLSGGRHWRRVLPAQRRAPLVAGAAVVRLELLCR